MSTFRILTAAALVTAFAVSTAPAQQAQTQRVRGTIEKVDGNKLQIKASNGAPITLTLTDNALIVGVVKASIADIKAGSYIGSGAVPQPDGTQKAVEVHIFAESQRGTGDGHRAWDGAPNGTMTNGAVGQTVSGVDGPVITVKYKDGEKKIVVTPNVPIVQYEIGDRSEIKPGAAVNIAAATKRPDGTFTAARVNVGRNGLVP
jgi:outer membrane lipoprotein SlyB